VQKPIIFEILSREAYRFMDDKERKDQDHQEKKEQREIFEIEEIKIEEMAIDGICGVY
jgi:mycofactocin precursor